ncbi:MAG: HlyD family efflux transporter periplasmic adaptor subunit [Pseudomonadota bacterium]
MKDDVALSAREAPSSFEDALAEVIEVDVPREAHAERVFRLAVALTGAVGGVLRVARRDAPQSFGPDDPQLAALATTALDGEEGRERNRDRLALRYGSGGDAFVIALRITGGGAALSVGWERLTMLATLSNQRERLSSNRFDAGLMRNAALVASGDWSAAQAFADDLRRAVGADAVALAAFEDRALARFVVSDAPALARTGAADDDLRQRLGAIGREETDLEGGRLGARRDGFGLLLIGCAEVERTWTALRPLFDLPRAKRPLRSRLRRLLAPALVATALAGLALLPVPDSVEATAVVAPSQQRTLTAPTAAPLVEMMVKEGDVVRAGDRIAAFETRDLDLSLSEARARLAAALTSLQEARSRRDETGRRDAELEMAQIEARINQYEALREASVLTANIDGIVSRDFGDQRIGSYFSVGEPVAEIIAREGARLEAWVSERDIARARVGDQAIFRSDADPETDVEVILTELSVAGEERAGLSTFGIVAEAPAGLKSAPGMTGVVAVDATQIPIGELVYRRLRTWMARRFWL